MIELLVEEVGVSRQRASGARDQVSGHRPAQTHVGIAVDRADEPDGAFRASHDTPRACRSSALEPLESPHPTLHLDHLLPPVDRPFVLMAATPLLQKDGRWPSSRTRVAPAVVTGWPFELDPAGQIRRDEEPTPPAPRGTLSFLRAAPRGLNPAGQGGQARGGDARGESLCAGTQERVMGLERGGHIAGAAIDRSLALSDLDRDPRQRLHERQVAGPSHAKPRRNAPDAGCSDIRGMRNRRYNRRRTDRTPEVTSMATPEMSDP